MPKKYVPEGSFLYCDKGIFPTPFRGLENSETFLTDVPIATDFDHKPFTNVLPFGPCIKKGGQFCLYFPVGKWNNPAPIFCGIAQPILDDSTLSCKTGGTIRIAPSFMEALLEMYDDPNEMIDKFMEYMGAKVDNSVHTAWGFLKGGWELLKFGYTLAVETSPLIQGYQALSDWEGYKDKWEGRYETTEDMANFGIQLYELQNDPLKQAQLLAYLSDGDNWEMAFEAVYEKIASADHTEVAEIQGMIAFEIVLEVLTLGWGAARHVDKVDDLADGARVVHNVLENLDEPAAVANGLEDLAVPGVDEVDIVPGGRTITGTADEVQDDIIQGVKDGDINLDVGHENRKGNFGEIVADRDLVDKGYEPLHERLTSIDGGHNGLDGVFKNSSPPPDYLIVESKYGKSSLNRANPDTGLPRQMSDDWIDGRLRNVVGEDLADEMSDLRNYERVLAKVDANGNVTYRRIGSDGYAILGNKGKFTP